MMGDTNDDDLEVAAVLAQGLGRNLSNDGIKSAPTGRQSGYSPRRSSTVLTNNSRGNVVAETSSNTGFESLHQLAAKGELLILQEIAVDESQINEFDEFGLTPVMWSAMYGQVDILSYLMQAGADVHMYNENGTTGLMMACYHGNHAAIRVFLEHGVNIDQADLDGNTALLYAVFNNQSECTRLLLEAGADFTRRNLQGNSPLDAAIKLGNKNVQKCLESYLIKCLQGT